MKECLGTFSRLLAIRRAEVADTPDILTVRRVTEASMDSPFVYEHFRNADASAEAGDYSEAVF